ncbi:MAG: M28 family peptidase [Bacteroidales bacterium]
MPRLFLFVSCLSIVLLFPAVSLQAQRARPEDYASKVTRKDLDYHIRYLSDSLLQGRETGSPGGSEATLYINNKFKEYGLRPLGTANPYRYNVSYIQGFVCPTGQRGRNVIGWIPAAEKESHKYIIISAHYDHLGVIEGIHYPGADSNASGVAALLSLAETFGAATKDGHGLTCNLIFVAYDAKEFSMTGARIFALSLGIPAEQVVLNLNLDQMGTTLAPPGDSRKYILILGAEKVPDHIIRSMDNNNAYYNTGLELDYSFYQSPEFAEIFFTMTEQYFLSLQNIPSLLITSGVNDHTYKPRDTPDIIDLPVLELRTRWLFFTLWDLIQR